MPGDSSERSSLIDLTFQQLYELLSETDNTQTKRIKHHLTCRKDQLHNIGSTFGIPSDASQKKVEDGTVVLADGITLRTNPSDAEYVRVISKEFNVDQVQALILIHSYIYDRGATSITSGTTAQELVEIITPFYRAERIAALRILIPLLRASQDVYGSLYTVSNEVLPQILQDEPQFLEALLSNYTRRTKDGVPDKLRDDPKAAMSWAKQNLKEQLSMLEVLFWIVWGHVSCDGPLMVKILEAAYSTSLGSSQANTMFLLDEESLQLQQDSAALWIVLTLEAFKLDGVAESSNNLRMAYLASNDCLKKLHELISSHTDSRYVCIYLAWAFLLCRLSNDPVQTSFLETLSTSDDRQNPTNRKPVYLQMLEACLSPDAGLLQLIFSLLTKSPLFVTSVAWKTGSWLCDPNATAFRSVIKVLVTAFVELIPIEQISDLDLFVEIWVALFGRSEIQTVASLCTHFWQVDWNYGINRRAVFNVACSRFPVQFHNLLRLLRCMTGTGFLDTDPLSTVDHIAETLDDNRKNREACGARVFGFLDLLSSYSQVVPLSACSGSHALYELQQRRYGTSNPQGLTYINLRSMRLPGGSTLPARSIGRVISTDNSDYLIICWQHQHSGWKLIQELLTGYVNRRHLQNAGSHKNISFAPRENAQILSLSLSDIGVNIEGDNEEALIIEALDLIQSLIHGNPQQAAQLMQVLQDGNRVIEHTFVRAQSPDLVQLTIMILEEALGRMNPRSKTKVQEQLIASAMSLLAAFVALPNCVNKVWLTIHQTTALFGSDKTMGLVSAALASERMMGHYTMTLSLLRLIQQLFREASITILPDNQQDQQFKEEILLRAMQVVHTDIWVEHPGWKYTRLGDKFEIGRQMSLLYSEILERAPPTICDGPFTALSQTIAVQLLSGATMSSINPLLSIITSGSYMVHKLYTSRRFGDARCLVFLLESHLHLITLLLNYKQQSVLASTPCLLEQIFSSQIGASSMNSVILKANPIDVIANYVTDKELGIIIPREAMKLLYALLSSLSVSYPSSSTIIGHLSNPEATVESLVTIAENLHDDLELKNMVWKFIALVVDKEPGLASLFVTGRFRMLDDLEEKEEKSGARSGEKEKREVVDVPKEKKMNAINAAKQVLGSWEEIWEASPKLLASVLQFLCVVWEHKLEHKPAINILRQNDEIWCRLQELVQKDLGPAPPYEAEVLVITENTKHSSAHEAVASYAYRTLAKTYAVRLFGLDIEVAVELDGKGKKPPSLIKFEPCFKEEDQLCDLLSDASINVYSPELYDQLLEQIKKHFPGLDMEQLRLQGPKDAQEFGDGYVFDISLLRARLHPYVENSPCVNDAAVRLLSSINMNLSLSDAQKFLTQSWVFFLQQCKPYIRGDTSARTNLISNVASISHAVVQESRSGEVVAMVQQARLSLLLAVLELVWFASKEDSEEVRSFVVLAKNVRGIILNETQSPANAINSSVPFHRPLLQIIYYCVKQARLLLGRELTADQRPTLVTFVEASLTFVIQALQIVFITARTKVDVDVDRDMELCVSVFEQCIRPDINLSSTSWLIECQTSGIIRNSLDLYAHIDLVGLGDLPFLHTKKQAPYAPHLLQLHMALASHATTAERLMNEGILTVYSNNLISSAISKGQIDIVLPEFPGERSPAHVAFCSMVSIIATTIAAFGRYNHYLDADVCAFVQLYSGQFSRALTWTIGDSITYPLLEEIEQTVNLFYAVAINSSSVSQAGVAIEQVLDFFKVHALNLLQQLNYAITHPNHITSLFEPVTVDERTQLEKEKPSADPLKRPLVTRLIHRICSLSSNIVGTLIVISKADSVLLTLEEEWPIHEALVAPYPKVVLDEPASLGTLLELGGSTLDVLQEILDQSPNQNITSAPSLALTIPTTGSADIKRDIVATRRNLEGILLYATTQLVMWLSKPDFASSPPEMDFESNSLSNFIVVDNSSRADVSSLKDRARAHKREPSALLGRGMTSEVVADLKSLLNKAKPVITKSATIIGKDLIDITQVLINFLQDHVAT